MNVPTSTKVKRPRYRPTNSQVLLRRLIRDNTRILAYGGSRSGKTFEFCRAMTVLALRYGGRYAVFRRYAKSAKHSVFEDTFPKMLDLCFPDVKYNRHASDPKIIFECNDAEICFVGLDDKRKLDKILGQEYAAVYFNECSEIEYEAVEIAISRLAQARRDDAGVPLKNRAFFDCNPTGKSHWTYRLFIEGVSPISGEQTPNPQDYAVIQINPIDNLENLPAGYVENTLATGSEAMKRRFLLGEFSNDAENALWKQSTIDKNRIDKAPEDLERIVVAVDPAVTSSERSDETGIVVVGKRKEPGTTRFYVLDDRSLKGTPDAWTRQVVDAYQYWLADAVVVETNQGGDLVENALRQVAPDLPIRKVRAKRGKALRAEPISVLYERGRVSHVGVFRALEDEMTSFRGESKFDKKDDRLDALVWAITDLMNEEEATCGGGFVYF